MPPRLKNEGALTSLRNDNDTADGDLRVKLITISDASKGEGKILTSDATGVGNWRENEAIELANTAQATAETAQATAETAQATADSASTAATAAQATADTAQATATAAQTAATAAQTTATAAAAAAAAAQTTATAAAAAAAVANGLAVAAGIDAANAQARADDAFALADLAYDKALASYPLAIRVFGDELFPTVGTPAYNLSNLYPYNNAIILANNGDSAYTYLNLRAGTWTFKFLTQNANSLGRVTISIGGNPLVDPQDLYSVTNDAKKVYTYAGFSILSDGQFLLVFTNSGKNASSSGFSTIIQKFWGIRTGV